MGRTVSQILEAEKRLVRKGKIDDTLIGKVLQREKLLSGCDYTRALFAMSFVQLYELDLDSAPFTIQHPTTDLKTELQTNDATRQAICSAVSSLWERVYAEVKACGGRQGELPENLAKYVMMALHYNESLDMWVYMEREGRIMNEEEEERGLYRQAKLQMRLRVEEERYVSYTRWKREHKNFVLDGMYEAVS